MTLPLPKLVERKCNPDAEGSNAGLHFDKFFDCWPEQIGGKIEPGNKLGWIKKFTGETVDASSHATRLKEIAIKLKGKVETFQTTGPFVTGMGLSNPVENGFLFHHTLGVPYLPGSSIKGMVRAWAQHWCATLKTEEDYDAHIDEICHLFGGPIYEEERDTEGKVISRQEIRAASAGSIIFFDALPVGSVELTAEIITPHTGQWRITTEPEKHPPADWVSPNPIPFLSVKEGASFQFALAPRTAAGASDLDTAFKLLKNALEWIGAGAKTAIGFGVMKTPQRLDEEKKGAQAKEQRMRQEQEESRQRAEKEAQAREAEQKAAWMPTIGHVVSYLDEEVRVISALHANGDFEASKRDGSAPVVTDKDETSFLAASWAEYDNK